MLRPYIYNKYMSNNVHYVPEIIIKKVQDCDKFEGIHATS